MATYLFKCDKCGHDHEVRIKQKDLPRVHTCHWNGCDGKLRRVYTPFSLRIK